jgi:hypothetical protein
MRARFWIPVLVCAALISSAGAATKVYVMQASKIQGQPSPAQDAQASISAWVDTAGFHVRWTTSDKPTLFSGRIDTDRPITELTRIFEFGPGWVQKQGDRIVMFSSTTRGDTDGFDLVIPGGKRLQMELSIDGAPAPLDQVFFGAKGEHPPGLPLLIYLR